MATANLEVRSRLGLVPSTLHAAALHDLAAAIGDSCFLGTYGLTWACANVVIHLPHYDEAAKLIVADEGILRSRAQPVSLELDSEEINILVSWVGLLPLPSRRLAAALAEGCCPKQLVAQAIHNATAMGVFAMWSYHDALVRNALIGQPLTIQRPQDGAVLVLQTFAAMLDEAQLTCPLVPCATFARPASLPSAFPAVHKSVGFTLANSTHQLVTLRGGASWIRLANDAISVWPAGTCPTLTKFTHYCASRGFSRRLATKAYDYATLSLKPGTFQRCPGTAIPCFPVRSRAAHPVTRAPTVSAAAANNRATGRATARLAARNLLAELSSVEEVAPTEALAVIASDQLQPVSAGHDITTRNRALPGRVFIAPSAPDIAALRNLHSNDRSSWLSDEVINSAAALMLRHAGPRCFCISSLAVSQCLSGGLSTVSHWPLWAMIMEADKVVVPINVDNLHWRVALIAPVSRSLAIWDSKPAQCELRTLGGHILDWLTLAQSLSLNAVGPWRLTLHSPDNGSHPLHQSDSSACGLFVAARMLEFLLELPHLFRQRNVPGFRSSLAVAIETRSLSHLIPPPWCCEAPL